jgi:predicted nucleotidyltransferase
MSFMSAPRSAPRLLVGTFELYRRYPLLFVVLAAGVIVLADLNSGTVFASYAYGDQRQDSDLDFLVIEPEVDDQFGESVRLTRLVGELGVPADVVVASEAHVHEWGGLSGR